MADPRGKPPADTDNDLSAQNRVTDPFTGTTAAGPITAGNSDGQGWGTAARWLALALLTIAFLVALYVFYDGFFEQP